MKDSCDCEEFGLPLAKKINQMNIEYEYKAMSTDNQGQECRDKVKLSEEFSSKYPFPQGGS